MDPELKDFISHLGDDEPFSPNQQMNEISKELEEYIDKASFDIDEYLDELLPVAQKLPSPMETGIPIPEQPTQVTIDELLKKFTISPTFFDDLIPDPVLDVENKNFVPTDILLKSIRSHDIKVACRNYDLPIASNDPKTMAPLRKHHSTTTTIDTNMNPSPSSNINWRSILQNHQPYPGISSDQMVKNILQSCMKMQVSPTQEEIQNVVGLLFKNLNSYIQRLSVEFEGHTFFDAVQFGDLSEKFRQDTLSQSGIKDASLVDVLSKWMEIITKVFANINDERRQVEEIVSEKIINKAVELYRKRNTSMKDRKDSSIARKKQSDIVSQGIRRVYSNCGANFSANVLRRVEEHLEKLNPTPDTPSIRRHNTTTPTDTKLLIELLVSDYVHNINQKGLQCAGISTLKQFDDVNRRCLSDVSHSFDNKMEGVPFAERNDLSEYLKSKLHSESDKMRSEFKERSSGVSMPSNLSSSSSAAKSYTVGIHFGLETLSVSCFTQGNTKFRTIFGPVVNVVSFTRQGVLIGEIPMDGYSLNMENLLKNLNVDVPHDTKYYGQFKLSAIIALMLMQIDDIAKLSLHTTTRIKYAIAIPSYLNEVMQHTFKTAINIADINGSLVREQCAITAKCIYDNRQNVAKNKDEFLITMLEMEDNACDSVVYEIIGTRHPRMMKVLRVDGSVSKNKYMGWKKESGFDCELKKLKNVDKRNRFIVCCANPESAIQHIKNQFKNSKVQSFKFDSNKFAEGAALLSFAAIDGYSSLDSPFDFRQLTSIKKSSSVNYRLMHKSVDVEPPNLMEISTQLRSLLESQSQELAKIKGATKKLLMGKMKDIEESYISEGEKDNYRWKLENDLKKVEQVEEPTKTSVVETISDFWTKSEFY